LPRILPLKGSARDGVSSCLDSRILQLVRRWNRGLPLSPALPVAPPDVAAGHPAPCIFRLCRRWIFELPRISHPSALLAIESPGRPDFSLFQLRFPMSPPGRPGFFIFRPCRRWIFGLPRISHPSARRGASAWGCPRSLALPFAPADEFPGCPGFSIFRLCRRRIFELPRISRPSALLALILRVAPRLRTSRCASQCGCRFPRTPHLPALPRV